MRSMAFILSILISLTISAQEKVTSWEATVDSDSILLGNQFTVTFTLKNARSNNFIAPSFEEFEVLMGPNQSSSMSIINGDVTQEMKFTYVLRPKDIGNFYIAPASIELHEEIVETSPIEIIVFPNPDGIINDNRQQDLNWNHLPWDPPKPKKLNGKKKKKIYKI